MEERNYFRETEYESLRRLMRKTEADGPLAGLVADALQHELTQRQAELVELYYVEQHSMREIAQLLGVNPSTVCRTLQTARSKLRRCLRYCNPAFLREED